MLTFNELRITPDGKYLIIDVSVNRSSYYDNIVVDSIVIDTQDTYVSSGPSNTPLYTYTVDSDALVKVYDNTCTLILNGDESYCFVLGESKNKDIRIILSQKDLGANLTDNMFFVYAIASGSPAPDTPCGMDNSILMGTVVDLYPIYCTTILYLKELNNECLIPRNLTNMILRIKALELSIKTGNYTLAIKYWKKFFLNTNTINNINLSNCGCNN